MLDYITMELRELAAYARQIRPKLSAHVFAPARSRLLWLPVHALVIAAGAWLIGADILPGYTWPLMSIVIGCSMAGLTFLGHETMHGQIVRGRWLIRVVGWLCFLPFTLSPRLWSAWHNRVHHNHCTNPGVDPDMYPTLEEYQTQKSARLMADYFAMGRRRVAGLASLLFGFTGQSTQILFTARSRRMLPPSQHRLAIAETLAGVAVWTAVAIAVGFVPFVFVYLIPLVVVNTIVMAFIMTNHSLSPLTGEVNDPLVNSLSVTLPRFFDWLTLGFGFHVEHHLFPTSSNRHGRRIRSALVENFRGRYQSMPMFRALRELYRTARVYKDSITLIDPSSGLTWSTILPTEPPGNTELAA
jgi:fatty acid desaturase